MTGDVMTDTDHLDRAITLAEDNIAGGGRPFGAVLVKDGQVLAAAANETHLNGDITAHAELLAISRACREHGPDAVRGATIHASGQPCPMCLAACHAAGVARVIFAGANAQGAPFGLTSQRIYDQLARPLAEQSIPITHDARERIIAVYRDWAAQGRG